MKAVEIGNRKKGTLEDVAAKMERRNLDAEDSVIGNFEMTGKDIEAIGNAEH